MLKKTGFTALALFYLPAAAAAPAPTLPPMRLTPADVRATAFNAGETGGAGLATIRTKVLFGDPSKAGFYTILLSVPAHTKIRAHSHRDDRMAAVVSGNWLFG